MKKVISLAALFAALASQTMAWDYYPTENLQDSKASFVDVRSIYAREFYGGMKPGSTWVDSHSIMSINDFLKHNSYDKNQAFVIYCSCPDDEYAIAMAELMDREGYTNVYVLKDGWQVLTEQNLIDKDDSI